MRRFDSSHVDNSHPVVAQRDAVDQADKQLAKSAQAQQPNSRGAPSAAPTNGTGSGSTLGSGSGTTGPLGGLVNNQHKLKLPLPGGKTGGGSSGSGSGSSSGASGGSTLGQGLGDAIETLLPDVSGLPKLH
jgi:hypothetical protein